MLDLTISLDDKYRRARGPVYLSGTQALVRLAMLQAERDRAAGLKTAGYVSGYRGSPLAALDFELWRARQFLEPLGIVFQPGLNEDLAATAVWGTQQVHFYPRPRYEGVFAMWYGKSPGVDRSGDAIRHGNQWGSARHGGVLLLLGDDHAQKSTSSTSQSEYAMADWMVPVLAPASLQDFLDLGLAGFALSRFSGLWTGFKLVDANINTSGTVEVDPDRPPFAIPEGVAMPPEGLNSFWFDDRIPQEARLKQFKIPAAQAFVRANRLDRILHDSPRARLGIVSAGKAWLDVEQALAELGLDGAACSALGLRVLKLGLIWPVEPETLARFAAGLEEILVVEEKRGFIEDQVKTILYDRAPSARPRVVGKRDEAGGVLLPDVLDLDANLVAGAIAARLGRFAPDGPWRERAAAIAARRPREKLAPIHARGPFFCSGCPHNTSTNIPEGSAAIAGIGCHSIAIWHGRAIGFTQMGGEGASWIGIAPFTDTPHIFQNVGDGTYFHSGSLGIRAAVASGVNVTFKILYNDAVAMTGGQPVDGTLTVPQITRQLHAEGVRRIAVVADDPGKYALGEHWAPDVAIRPRGELDAVQRELRESPGVTALVYDQTCAALKRRRRKRGAMPDPARRVFINELVCEGCGDCSTVSNCVSVRNVETEFGNKRAIDQASCNKDMSCLEGFCPSFVTVEGGRPRRATQAMPAADPPEPLLPALDRPHAIAITGVGGSGVLTVSAILGMAAHLAGRAAAVSDIVGLSQKNGPVMSQITLAADPASLHAAQIAPGTADALIACDLITTTMPEAMSKLAPGRTRAVVNLAAQPTGEFVARPDQPYEIEAMRKRVEAAIDRERSDFLDAHRLALALVGDSIAANMLMTGFAWQRGLIPLPRAAIEQAIRLDGTAVAANLDAFAWGRRAAHDPASLAEKLQEAPAPPRTLAALVERRAGFLAAYQDAAYAARYRAAVERVREAEEWRTPGRSGLAEAAARFLFKLMAYKDEYEVARLYTDGTFASALARQFEGDYRLRFHLAPPLIASRDPATGRLEKRSYGAWMLPVFRLLARLRFLRGTPFDPFGWTAERRCERRLLRDYERLLGEIAARVSPENHAAAVALASLPERIRGYGHVKDAAIDQAKIREAELLAEFAGSRRRLEAA